jgi:hypothetical protein
MAAEHRFEHLALVLRTRGPARLRGGDEADAATAANKQNRTGHSSALQSGVTSALTHWESRQARRDQEGLPSIEAGIPLLLKIDTSLDMEDLRHYFAFEIVSEQEDGFVIVASEDLELTTFQQKLSDFVTSVKGSASVAKIHELRDDPTQEERLGRILSEALLAEWHAMDNDNKYIVDVSVACTGNWQISRRPKEPKRRSKAAVERWAAKEEKWRRDRGDAYGRWDQLKEDRLQGVKAIVDHYAGEELLSVDGQPRGVASLPDCFTLRLRLPAKGLKDLVLNYPYVFEVTEPDDIETPQQVYREYAAAAQKIQIIPPEEGAPAICVIDSGIQEQHLWLEPAIDKLTSHCFLPGTPTDVADYVEDGGHGTRVAGAIIHGETIPQEGQIRTHVWVQNARVLDATCTLPKEIFPPVLFREVVNRYNQGPRRTRIFNHSINAVAPCRKRHMSAWAAEIDYLSQEYDVLVVQSAGNIWSTGAPSRIGVVELIGRGKTYPDYLSDNSCRIANPAQSLQALTVGSVAYGQFRIDDWQSFAGRAGDSSAFSRCGLGIWETIKPEVVEYGGDFLHAPGNPPSVSTPHAAGSCYPELLRSTLYGGPAYDRDDVGTSFAAPKVTRIAGCLQAVLPEQSCLLYRALIVQSARWPEWAEALNPVQQTALLKRIGYGIPDMERATRNTDHRATYITAKDKSVCAGECHVYQVSVPYAMRRPGDDYDIRIEVTLSYVAEPRRTRRTHRGYLSTWVDWVSIHKGELLETFITRALRIEKDYQKEGDSLGWTIESNPVHGRLRGVRRSTGTVQKDWALVKSNALPENLCIAVRGHRGWSRDPESAARYSLVVSLEIVGKEIAIYEPLRAAVQELQAELEVDAEAIVEVDE